MISSFHFGRPGRPIAAMAALIALIVLALAFRITEFVEASNAVRDDSRQLAATARSVEADLRRLALAEGVPATGNSQQLLVQLLARRAERELAAQNAVARSEAVPDGDALRPSQLSQTDVLERLGRIYLAKATGSEIGGAPAPAAWVNEQLETYGFDWRVKDGGNGKYQVIAAPGPAETIIAPGSPSSHVGL
ncbi:MAG: hypothetical protein ACOY5R_21920 [Pseudomonadota bacterium]|uniref:hypothetical protein n=1 Tax=Rhizorhabdus phycosphaerae TaxID=2711156 RepID=UPI0013EC0FC9|nr:hypothetical protein [Rhizorhabdus phycosphaerae]